MNQLKEVLPAGPWVFVGENANEFYHHMLSTINLEGERSSPRGLPTTELLHAITHIKNPRQRVLTQPGRKLNPFFNLAETVWILSGKSESNWILFFNSQLIKYLDAPMRHFHGAYGERIRHWPRVSRMSYHTGQDKTQADQLLACFQSLSNDRESRQAVLSLWNAHMDAPGIQTKDRPCNIAVTFKLRRNKLHMSVFNRSNDVVLGLTSTNIVQFSTMQEVLASWLSVDVGEYTHYSDSLHLYDSQDISKQTTSFNVYDYVDATPMNPVHHGIFDQMLQDLFMLFQRVILGDDPTRMELENAVSLGSCPLAHPCPYWQSVAWALTAYAMHKLYRRKDLAIEAVSRMATADWKVECLRFLADRYVEDEPAMSALYRVGMDIPFIQDSMEGRQALMSYIFQSAKDKP